MVARAMDRRGTVKATELLSVTQEAWTIDDLVAAEPAD
jgi:hypothetical protein